MAEVAAAGVKSPLPGEAVTPEPAPDEEPAEFDTGPEDEAGPPFNVDWT